jgi:hypothetical protein
MMVLFVVTRASAIVTCRGGRGAAQLAAGRRPAGRPPVQPTKMTAPASAQANRKHIRGDNSIIPFGTHPVRRMTAGQAPGLMPLPASYSRAGLVNLRPRMRRI